MARVTTFVRASKERLGRHTDVTCGYTIFDKLGETFVQLDTYGSPERQRQGRVSQSLVLDAAATAELRKILKRAFGP